MHRSRPGHRSGYGPAPAHVPPALVRSIGEPDNRHDCASPGNLCRARARTHRPPVRPGGRDIQRAAPASRWAPGAHPPADGAGHLGAGDPWRPPVHLHGEAVPPQPLRRRGHPARHRPARPRHDPDRPIGADRPAGPVATAAELHRPHYGRGPQPKLRVYTRIAGPPQQCNRSRGLHLYVHSKMAVIDDELLIVGSANCSNRGWETDSELAVASFEEAAPGAVTTAKAPAHVPVGRASRSAARGRRGRAITQSCGSNPGFERGRGVPSQ